GTDGVEGTYGPQLDGRNLPLRVNDLGRIFSSAQPTADVTLTLTNALQQAATAALGPRIGAVVALDPTTGAVLAMVSQPTYDPNQLATHDANAARQAWTALNANPDHPLLDRSFRERYAPGSTFKVVTSAATLDRMPDLATKSYPFLTDLKLPQTTHTLHNFGGESCGGTLPDILRLSCDTAFAQMGLDLGGTNLAAEAVGFGFAGHPPLDLPSPIATSTFPDPATFPHNLPSLAFSAIGQQDVSATPLEMALIVAGVANKGVIMTPHVMASIRDNEGRVVRTFTPSPWMTATSPQTAATLTQLMIGVVQGGTGTGVALPGVQVAAKTGTAELDPTHVNAWMIAFAPADAPKIAVAVVLPGLTGIGNEVTGGVKAAPVVRAVLAAYLGIKL
ncbi:MAG TPA: penicillin-binding transpeptidase domain-containing protein, partial [Acidimicrobiales bacterium]|nr:penicillin-binding transpeptidase domain-containing protein [Acidimicrobiales bacterium]